MQAHQDRKARELEKKRKENEPPFRTNTSKQQKNNSDSCSPNRSKTRSASPLDSKKPNGLSKTMSCSPIPNQRTSAAPKRQAVGGSAQQTNSKDYHSLSPQRSSKPPKYKSMASEYATTGHEDHSPRRLEKGETTYSAAKLNDDELLSVLVEARNMIYSDESEFYKILESIQSTKQITEPENHQPKAEAGRQQEIENMKTNIETLQTNLFMFQESFRQVMKETLQREKATELPRNPLEEKSQNIQEKPQEKPRVSEEKKPVHANKPVVPALNKELYNTIINPAQHRHPSFELSPEIHALEERINETPRLGIEEKEVLETHQQQQPFPGNSEISRL